MRADTTGANKLAVPAVPMQVILKCGTFLDREIDIVQTALRHPPVGEDINTSSKSKINTLDDRSIATRTEMFFATTEITGAMTLAACLLEGSAEKRKLAEDR